MRDKAGKRSRRARAAAPGVLVIGAGVSGCACAAALASRGVGVTLLGETLDGVGRPQFGPVVSANGGLAEVAEVLGRLPKELGEVWLDAAMVPDGAGFLIVDRRMVSVETKRRLEAMGEVEFRQGVAREISVRGGNGRGSDGGRVRVAVETVFGEVLEGAAVVVAVGLKLGEDAGEGRAGKEEGGSGGSVRGGMRTSLERLGAEFAEVSAMVGPSVALEGGPSENVGRKCKGAVGGAKKAERGETIVRIPVERVVGRHLEEWGGRGVAETGGGMEAGGRNEWPSDWPMCPLWREDLWPTEALVRRDSGAVAKPWMSPDGVVTGEWYVGTEAVTCAKGREAEEGGKGKPEGGMVTRIGGVRRGLVACNVDEVGRLQVDGADADMVWITGRAAGARIYLESLAAGVRTGAAVAGALGVSG